MAKPTSKQQTSQLKKLLFVGVGLVVIVLVAFPSGSSTPTSSVKKPFVGVNGASKKTKDSLYTEDDRHVKFEAIGASIKNGFNPLVKKGDGEEAPTGGIPKEFAGGEGTWTYTGNMVVDGTPNALLENSSTGDGVFLRPGQHWKNLRLIAVKEDSIELEGPSGQRKTVYFDDKGVSPTSGSSTTLQALPPATIQGNLPNGANPQLNQQPGGNPRRQRGQQANMDGMVGEIGSSSNFEVSANSPDQGNFANNNGNNRRIRSN